MNIAVVAEEIVEDVCIHMCAMVNMMCVCV